MTTQTLPAANDVLTPEATRFLRLITRGDTSFELRPLPGNSAPGWAWADIFHHFIDAITYSLNIKDPGRCLRMRRPSNQRR